MRHMPKVTVITVTFNGKHFLEDFISSLLATDQTGIEVEILVVDNGSMDGSVDWIRSNHPQIKVLENDENNYARALNLGIASSQGEYVVVTNNDATVHPNWLQGFIEVFHNDESIGAVQSKIYFYFIETA